MYLSELKLENFRGFKECTSILFNDGMNIIIGPNNGGKSSIIKALSLFFGNESKRLGINDFYKDISKNQLKKEPPRIKISLKFMESEDEDEFSEEVVAVSTWLTKLAKPYEALLTYDFFLPEQYEEEYRLTLKKINSGEIDDYWDEIENKFLKKYVYKIFAGNPKQKNLVDRESLTRFDFQFLDAIRDVERDLTSGKNALLKEVIDFFMDYDIKTNEELSDQKKKECIATRKKEFSEESKKLIKSIQERMEDGKGEMLKYAKDTGALFDNLSPSFEGKIRDTELYSALKLIVENETGMKLPVKNNGLGYNNLVYISLLLAKMQKNASADYLGSNAKVYSILAIEEPEAHLHPNMQYKFLKFLYDDEKNKANQIFITSHSPNITAAAPLDNIIILYKYDNEISVSYPGKTFNKDNKDDLKSKKFIERFLDVTKADMLFADSLILVEGITEQLTLPEFAKKDGKDLSDTHTSVINIGGLSFNHFIKLFNHPYGLKKKVACVTDRDPAKKVENKWVKAYPYEYNNEHEYEDMNNSFLKDWEDTEFVRVYTQEEYGCTFEYELFLKNIENKNIITNSVTNRERILEIMDLCKNDTDIKEIVKKIKPHSLQEDIQEKYPKSKFENKELKKHIMATVYLKSIEDKKGIIAQELVELISDKEKNIQPPKYFDEVIEWIHEPAK